jgi:tetratricopeptide (TPR) repeat protein
MRRLLLAALAALVWSASASVAQSDPAQERARAQVDGITGSVLDKLWSATDEYWHDGDYYRIIDLCRIIAEGDPADDEVYSSAAYLLWSLGDTKAADWMLQYGVRRAPKKGLMYHEMGWHLYNTRRYKEALPYLEKAAEYKSPLVTTYTVLGHTYTRLGRLEDAVRAWKVVVERFPGFASGPVNLKRAEERLAASKGK